MYGIFTVYTYIYHQKQIHQMWVNIPVPWMVWESHGGFISHPPPSVWNTSRISKTSSKVAEQTQDVASVKPWCFCFFDVHFGSGRDVFTPIPRWALTIWEIPKKALYIVGIYGL